MKVPLASPVRVPLKEVVKLPGPGRVGVIAPTSDCEVNVNVKLPAGA
jgi:hypothetical protein